MGVCLRNERLLKHATLAAMRESDRKGIAEGEGVVWAFDPRCEEAKQLVA
jgi:hypothetical protein